QGLQVGEKVLAQREENTRGDLRVIVTVECADAVAQGGRGHHDAAENEQQVKILGEQDVIDQNLGEERPEQAEDRAEQREEENENEAAEKWRDERDEAAETREGGRLWSGHILD